MKRLLFTPLFLLFLFTAGLVNGQESPTTDAEKYKVANTLLKQAQQKIKEGDLGSAEKLYVDGFNIYPIYWWVNQLPKAMLAQGDVKGGNRLWAHAIKCLQKYPNNILLSKFDGMASGFSVQSSNWM